MSFIEFKDLNLPMRTKYFVWEDEGLANLTPHEICEIYDDHLSHELIKRMNDFRKKYGYDMPLDMLPSWADYRQTRRY